MLRQWICSVGLVLWTCFSAAAVPAQRPNFVFLFADDLGWGEAGCYGGKTTLTPNLDRLAKEGTRFAHGYVSASVCSPSRAACMTGLYPARTGVHGHFASHAKNEERGMPDSLDPSFPTLPGALQAAGYKTAHFGKWHLGELDASRYGFDLAKTANGGGTNQYEMPDGFYYFFKESSERFVDDAGAFMAENKDHPFYLQLWFLEPHAPNLPHDEFVKLYRQPKGGVPEELIIPDPLSRYKAVVSNMDYHLGRLLNKLDELGLSENTVIVFSSDNGPEDHHISNKANTLGMGEPGPFRGRKRSLYDGGVRMPFIVRWPGVTPAGAVDNDSVVGCIDLFPTFAALAGAELPETLDGENILAALRGEHFERARPLFWEWRYGIAGYKMNVSPTHAVRVGKWKFYVNHDGSRKELYDVQASPMELDNLVSEYPDKAHEMEQLIMQWRKTIPAWNGDSWAGDNSYPWPESY